MTREKSPLSERLYHALGSRNITPLFLAATALLIFIQYRIDQKISGDSPGAIYLHLAFTRFNFESILASWGNGGIKLYTETLWIDFFLAFCAAMLLSSAAVLFQKKRGLVSPERIGKIFLFVPFIYMAVEFIENSIHYIIFSRHIFNEKLIMATSLVSLVKLLLLYTSLGWMIRCYRDFRKNPLK